MPDAVRKAASSCVIFQYLAIGLFILCPFTLGQFIIGKLFDDFNMVLFLMFRVNTHGFGKKLGKPFTVLIYILSKAWIADI